MDTIKKLTEMFSEFPGIGPRQARRFTYYLLTRQNGYLNELAKHITELKGSISICSSCFRYFPLLRQGSAGHAPAENLCSICRDPHRDHSQLLIVSRDIDLENIEKSHFYNGLYFVLGGTVPILEKEPENRIRQGELLQTVERRTTEELKEIILAMSLNPEGENTEEHVARILKPLTESKNIKISHLGRGLSTGTELEYSDSETIVNALKNRQ